jgi:DNA polymerase elongation subunit (family B)
MTLLRNDVEVFALDIETVQNEAMIGLLPEPEVKIGNIKDPKKIEEKRIEAKKKQIENMALHPETGMICSYAIYGEGVKGGRVIESISYSEEISLIKEILALLDNCVVVTYNGMNFDFPYIFKRAMINSIDMSDYDFVLKKFTQRYSISPHFDVMQVWSNWNREDWRSLDYLADLLLGQGKTVRDYSEYLDLIEKGEQKKIFIDNVRDAELAYRIFKKMENYFYNLGDL